MNKLDEQQLLDLKKQIEQAKTQVAELQGSRKHLMKELKDDWGCTTIEEAEKKLKKLQKELEQLQNKIKEQTEELIEKYNLEVG